MIFPVIDEWINVVRSRPSSDSLTTNNRPNVPHSHFPAIVECLGGPHQLESDGKRRQPTQGSAQNNPSFLHKQEKLRPRGILAFPKECQQDPISTMAKKKSLYMCSLQDLATFVLCFEMFLTQKNQIMLYHAMIKWSQFKIFDSKLNILYFK